jgi:hypothetical protein
MDLDSKNIKQQIAELWANNMIHFHSKWIEDAYPNTITMENGYWYSCQKKITPNGHHMIDLSFTGYPAVQLIHTDCYTVDAHCNGKTGTFTGGPTVVRLRWTGWR